ncbi:MAG: response regulator [Verrucomicrobia bacterium]|nr:response regulator [Verrucomicrobiota bacterium]
MTTWSPGSGFAGVLAHAPLAQVDLNRWMPLGFVLLAIVILIALLIARRREARRIETTLAEIQASERRKLEALQATERLAQETEQQYRALFDDAIVGMARSTKSGPFITVNRAFANMLGYDTPEEMMAKIRDISRDLYVRPHERVEAVRRMTEIGTIETREIEVYRRDGSTTWILAHTHEVRDADGNHLYFIGTIQDVSMRRLLEDKVRQSQKMEAIGRLTGGVAHDFNNLLTAMLGYAHFAAHKLGPGHPMHSYIEQIQRAGERAETLTRQLLNFCRQAPLERQTFDLNLVVKETGYLLRRLIGEDIQLRMQLHPDGTFVSMDSGEASQVVMNLALNARDAMPGGGELIIETICVFFREEDEQLPDELVPGSYAQLTVSDTGCGIDTATLERIFEPFFTTKQRGSGTGLGLSTCWSIVRQAGGTITVESAVGKGTQFRVYLPLADAEHATVTERAPVLPTPEAEVSSGRGTVLVVEDEDVLRRLLTEILEVNGYQVLTATDGEDALRLSNEHPGHIELVVTDLVMPRMNGCVLVGLLLQQRPDLQVLYISGHADHALLDQAVESGDGFAILHKPFRADELARAVKEAIERAEVAARPKTAAVAAAEPT